MDRLTPLRAPLAALALAVLTLVAAARVVLGLSEVVALDGSRAVAAARLAPNGSDAALTVLVGVLVAACFAGPAVPARRRLAAWGAVLTLVSLVATLVALGLTNLVVAGWNLVWSLPDLAVPVLVGIALLALARPGAAGADVRPGPTPGDLAVGLPAGAATATTPAPDPELEPSWSQDAAAGAVWRTAGEAARGVPAQDWAADGQTGWPSFRAPAAPADDPAASASQRPDSTTPSATPALPAGHDGRDARPDRV